MRDLAAILSEAAAAGQAGDRARARQLYDEALGIDPRHPAAVFGSAQVALSLGDVHVAALRLSTLAESADASLRPALAQAFATLADALRSRGAFDAAMIARDHVVRLAPDVASAWFALGNACMEAAQARVDRAHAGTASTAAFDPLAAALAAFGRACALAPGTPAIEAARALAARHACAFDEARAARVALRAVAAGGDFACEPMAAVALLDDAGEQRAGIEGYVRRALPAAMPTAAPVIVRGRGTRLRVGYLSSDLHDHATAHLAAGLFERHDRTRFEVFAYASDRDDGSPMRARLRRAFEHWRDVRDVDDATAAAAIVGDGIDVLIDLKGHTHGARLPILARRPAAVQIHYLGFPGTLGYPGAIDAVVADAVVAPQDCDREFAERVLRLPLCYQVNDARRVLPTPARRGDVGLPDDAVVLASFNQPYKLTEPFVMAWFSVLREVPSALLWLTVPHELTRRHLVAAAMRAGVATDRLVFAPPVRQAAHLARLQCADLALDVLPYGSHTTGSDALFCGVPMLTLRGTTFAGRVGASLLHATGLDELVTESLAGYTALLANLAGDRERLAHLHDHLVRGRTRLPLFDTEGFTRAFERMLEDVAAR